MQKTLLVKLVEEYYGAGKSERVYGRLAEEMRLVGRSTWLPMWRCVAALRQEFGPENVLVLGSIPTTRCWPVCWALRRCPPAAPLPLHELSLHHLQL